VSDREGGKEFKGGGNILFGKIGNGIDAEAF